LGILFNRLESNSMSPQDQLHRAQVNDFPPLWASSWGDDEYGLWADLTITSNNITATQKMRWIEPSQEGGFLMGSTKEERNKIREKDIRSWVNRFESEPFRMHVKNGFWLANTPCTQSFWTAVVGSNPSHFKEALNAANLPVENIAFKDDKNKEASVEFFLDVINQILQSLSPNELNPNALTKADLPTEIEWEYACRADTTTAYWWGNDFDEKKANTNPLGKKTWNDKEGTSQVFLYPPNPWGLYDMHGNVWEWTSSNWKANLTDVHAKEEVSRRVMRGDSWDGHPDCARAAYRIHRRLGDRYRDLGLRLLLRSSS
jgi:formylglycine-generating enzyme required for sulfatase activity